MAREHDRSRRAFNHHHRHRRCRHQQWLNQILSLPYLDPTFFDAFDGKYCSKGLLLPNHNFGFLKFPDYSLPPLQQVITGGGYYIKKYTLCDLWTYMISKTRIILDLELKSNWS